MKTRMRSFLRKILRVAMILDRCLIQLLGGQKKFKPRAINFELISVEPALSSIVEADKNSFKQFEQVSNPPFLAQNYIHVRNKLFTLMYRVGKRVTR